LNKESFVSCVFNKKKEETITPPLILSNGNLITLKDSILENLAFKDFLKLKESNGNNLIFKNLHLQVSKFYDIILNIIKKLEDNFKNENSTLILMTEYIIPNINSKSIHTSDLLVILNEIIIPYLYKFKNMKSVIHHFS
jgi:hypothetical protein